MSGARFRVGVDRQHRLYFVRDTWTGRCRGTYGTAHEAYAAAQRGNKALGVRP